MRKFDGKDSRARGQVVKGSQNVALQNAVIRNLNVFKKGQKVRRRKDGAIFTVRECSDAGLRFDEVSGLFSPDFFERMR